MTKRMLVDAAHAEETRVVVAQDNELLEFDFESTTKSQLKGNIYLAKVTRVEPSLQAAFVDCGGAQCGFCSPGMVLIAHALLQQNPDPSDDEIATALTGNLCRCTGYVQIAEAIKKAAALMKGGEQS